MPSNPMQRKIRNSFLLGILTMLVIALLIGAVVFLLIIKPDLDKKKLEEDEIYAYVYKLKDNVELKSGNEITSNMVEEIKIPVKQTNKADYFSAKTQDQSTKKLIDKSFTASGYRSKIDIKGGTILTSNMLYEDEELNDSLRYMEYNVITMPTILDVGDFVDIRLRLPNGQDLIVTSKKEIINSYDSVVGLNLTEDEIVILNSAIVEAYIMPGSELYMSKYVEPGMQIAATYTYMPTDEVLSLIDMNENIVSTAKNRLADLYQREDVRNVRSQIYNVEAQYSDDDKMEYREAGMQEQITAARKARESYLEELNGY